MMRKDRIRKKLTSNSEKVTQIRSKIEERKLNWYCHVMRRNGNCIKRQVMIMEMKGRRRKSKFRWKNS